MLARLDAVAAFAVHPAVAPAGPSQCGNPTLARAFAGRASGVIFFDLVKAIDRRKLTPGKGAGEKFP